MKLAVILRPLYQKATGDKRQAVDAACKIKVHFIARYSHQDTHSYSTDTGETVATKKLQCNHCGTFLNTERNSRLCNYCTLNGGNDAV
jgi:ribosomal protein S27AE